MPQESTQDIESAIAAKTIQVVVADSLAPSQDELRSEYLKTKSKWSTTPSKKKDLLEWYWETDGTGEAPDAEFRERVCEWTAFVANLFNTWPGLAPLEETEAPPPIEDFDAEGEREARVFTLWLNSLDVEPGVYNLFEDLKVSV